MSGRRALVSFVVVLALPAFAGGATFVVDRLDDAVDALPGDGLCWAEPGGGCSLRAAMMEASALGDDLVAQLGPGVHVLTLGGADVADGSDLAVGDLDWAVSHGMLEVSGAGAGVTVLQSDGDDRVLDVRQGAIVMLDGLTLRGGAASNGGAIQVRQAFASLGWCAISGNAAGFEGGAVWMEDSYVSLSYCHVSGNSSGGPGGAFCTDDSMLGLTRTRVSGNAASSGNGGGVFVRGGRLEAVESTLDRNESTAPGGGIACHRDARSTAVRVALVNSTLTENGHPGVPPVEGGGLYVGDAEVTVHGCTIVRNHGTDVLVDAAGTMLTGHTVLGRCGGFVESLGWNHVDAAFTCSVSGPLPILGDPQLEALADNGGPTPTCLPRSDSPVVDAGNPDRCLSSDGMALDRDQRGAPRPADGNWDFDLRCDIGAVEYWADSDGDGIPDEADCAPLQPTVWRVPAEVPGLRVRAVPGIIVVTWEDPGRQAGPNTYSELASGLLGDLPASGDCLTLWLRGTIWHDIAPAGDRWYLVRAFNDCGDGPWGSDSRGAARAGCP